MKVSDLLTHWQGQGKKDFYFFILAHGASGELLQKEMMRALQGFSWTNSFAKGPFKTFKAPLTPLAFGQVERFCHQGIFALCSGFSWGKFPDREQALANLPGKLPTLVFGEDLDRLRFALKEGDPFWFIFPADSTFWVNLSVWKTSYRSLLLPASFFQFSNNYTPPSKAYFKMKEGHFLHQIPFQLGQKVLEIGAAPGGVSAYLLQQGLRVLSVDPAQMNGQQLPHLDHWTHLQISLQNLTWSDLKKSSFFPDWIVVDMNLTPAEGLLLFFEFLRKSPAPAILQSIKGIFFVLKMGDKTNLDKLHSLYRQYAPYFARISPLIQLHSQKKEVHFWGEGPVQLGPKFSS